MTRERRAPKEKSKRSKKKGKKKGNERMKYNSEGNEGTRGW